jgi:cellulose synthase/poly-beta-1,6-N-acetylglucosamine synthase-like glycosyltransferase
MGETVLPLFTLCATIIAIQLVYLLVFLVAFRRAHQAKEGTAPLSVIVCAHNEVENLKQLVPSLLAQDHPDFEVIVVDDRSGDGSYEFLLESSKRYPRLRLVTVSQTPGHINGKKFALTLGIKAARNEWVVLTDADCRPDSHSWLKTMAGGFSEQKKIVIGVSPYKREPGLLNAFIRFETLLTMIQYVGMALAGRPYMGVGRNLAYRRSLFLDNKGFNDHLHVTGGDDDLFVNRHASSANVAIVLGGESLVHSAPKTTWTAFWGQKIRHLAVGKRYRAGDRLLLGTFSLTWILSWFSLASLPFLGMYSYFIVGLFLLRWILLVALFSTACRRAGVPTGLWKVPFLDFLYTFYYLVAGPAALLSKKVRWKN